MSESNEVYARTVGEGDDSGIYIVQTPEGISVEYQPHKTCPAKSMQIFREVEVHPVPDAGQVEATIIVKVPVVDRNLPA